MRRSNVWPPCLPDLSDLAKGPMKTSQKIPFRRMKQKISPKRRRMERSRNRWHLPKIGMSFAHERNKPKDGLLEWQQQQQHHLIIIRSSALLSWQSTNSHTTFSKWFPARRFVLSLASPLVGWAPVTCSSRPAPRLPSVTTFTSWKTKMDTVLPNLFARMSSTRSTTTPGFKIRPMLPSTRANAQTSTRRRPSSNELRQTIQHSPTHIMNVKQHFSPHSPDNSTWHYIQPRTSISDHSTFNAIRYYILLRLKHASRVRYTILHVIISTRIG